MATPSDLTQTGKTLIFALINTANPSLVNGAIDDSNVTLSAPAVLTSDASGKNTKLTLTAKADQGYTGTADVTYNRLDLQAVADIKVPGGLSLVDASYATGADLIAAINTALGTALVAGDFTNASTAISGSYPRTATLTAVTTSLVFVGSLAVTITEPQVALADALTTTDLDGLTAPAA